jgi:hypothetical protein
MKLRRNTASSFRNDLDASLTPMAKQPVGAEVLEVLSSRGNFDAVNRLEDGSKRGAKEPLH